MFGSSAHSMPALRVPPKALTFAFFSSIILEAVEVGGVARIGAGEAALDPFEAELVEASG